MDGFREGWIGENRVTGEAEYYKSEERARENCDLVLPAWVPLGADLADEED